MDLANSLRQEVKSVLRQYPTGVWLHELAIAWGIVHRQPRVQFQAACLQAGFPDPVALVKSCAFCQVTVQAEANRPMVKYDDPIPKLEGLARQLRLDICSRYEHAAVSDIVFEVCRHFKVPSLNYFCVVISSVPTLQQVAELNAKVSDFAAAYVGAR